MQDASVSLRAQFRGKAGDCRTRGGLLMPPFIHSGNRWSLSIALSNLVPWLDLTPNFFFLQMLPPSACSVTGCASSCC